MTTTMPGPATDPLAPQRGDLPGKGRVLTLSTCAFTVMFAVWLMFGVLGIPIRKEFGLSDVQLSWITSVAVLNGSLWRLLTGIAADRWGGRVVMSVMLALTAVPAWLVSQATSYAQLLLFAFLVGFAGNSFSVGISWTSAWFPAWVASSSHRCSPTCSPGPASRRAPSACCSSSPPWPRSGCT